MATEISNGKQTLKLCHSVNRGKTMYRLAWYAGGRRVQKNFGDKAEAKRVAKQILGGYISHCRQSTGKLVEAFPGLSLSDLTTP